MNFIKNVAKDKSDRKDNAVANVLKGSVIAVILSIIALIIFSIVLTKTNLAQKTINPIIMGITTISIFIGSISSVSKIEKKGIINGGLVGLIYVFSIYLISGIINSNFSFNTNSIILIISSLIAGMIGGIIGVNIRR